MALPITARLILSELGPNDAPFILELMNTPTWKKFIGDRNLKTNEDAKNYIVDRMMPSYTLSGFGFYKCELKEGNVPIGICGIVKRDALEHVDIGFAFLPQYEGKGYGFESASAVMQYAQTTLGIKVLTGICNSDNVNSISLLKKLGLRYQKMILLPNETEEIMLFSTQF